MANGSLTKKIIHGKSYYYLRFSRRVRGKPKVVRTVYLGKAEDILAAIEKRRRGPRPQRIVLAEFGAVAAIWSLLQQTGLIELIDRHVPKRSQGPSVGQYLALAVVNRVICPKSKRKIGAWFAKTVLPRLLHATPDQRRQCELLGDGEGLHWPLVDEDLSVEGLLAGRPSHSKVPRGGERSGTS